MISRRVQKAITNTLGISGSIVGILTFFAVIVAKNETSDIISFMVKLVFILLYVLVVYLSITDASYGKKRVTAIQSHEQYLKLSPMYY